MQYCLYLFLTFHLGHDLVIAMALLWYILPCRMKYACICSMGLVAWTLIIELINICKDILCFISAHHFMSLSFLQQAPLNSSQNISPFEKCLSKIKKSHTQPPLPTIPLIVVPHQPPPKLPFKKRKKSSFLSLKKTLLSSSVRRPSKHCFILIMGWLKYYENMCSVSSGLWLNIP